MKKKLIYFTLIAMVIVSSIFVCACNVDAQSSVKMFTRPYIAEYECTNATLGDENLLDKYEFIKIILTDKENAELLYKPKNGDKHVIKSTYEYNTETNELRANFGIFGHEFKPTVTIKDGKFSVNKTFGHKQLTMNFKAK